MLKSPRATPGQRRVFVRLALACLAAVLLAVPLAGQTLWAQEYVGDPSTGSDVGAAAEADNGGGGSGPGVPSATATSLQLQSGDVSEGTQAVPIGTEMSPEDLQRLKQQAEGSEPAPPGQEDTPE
jgi:hypothetical protein